MFKYSKDLERQITKSGMDDAKLKQISVMCKQEEDNARDKIALVQFWRQAKYYQNTCILDGDYQELEKAGLLISDMEIKTNAKPRKIHTHLPAEPFVGDLLLANCFVVTLNPRAALPYSDEYENWSNPELKDLAEQNRLQKSRMYPFYYLDTKLETTGGGLWWLKTLGLDKEKIDTVANKFNMPVSYLRRLVATHFCDIELCPYHSNQWDNNKLKQLIIDKKLQSSVMVIDFIKQVINDKDKTVFIRGDKDSGYVSNILQHFIPELKHDLSNVHYISGQRVWLQPSSVNGQILFDKICGVN